MVISWGRGFFRLWLVVALLWVVPASIFVTYVMLEGLWPIPVPATIRAADQKIDEVCHGKKDILEKKLCEVEQSIEHGDTLTAQEKLLEAEWRDANERRTALIGNLGTVVARMMALVFLPPFILLLPGLLAAWIGRGFTKTPS